MVHKNKDQNHSKWIYQKSNRHKVKVNRVSIQIIGQKINHGATKDWTGLEQSLTRREGCNWD